MEDGVVIKPKKGKKSKRFERIEQKAEKTVANTAWKYGESSWGNPKNDEKFERIVWCFGPWNDHEIK